MLKVIKGKEKKSFKPDYNTYARALNRLATWILAQYFPDNETWFQQYPDKYKQFLYLNIKALPLLGDKTRKQEFTPEEAAEQLRYMFSILDLIKLLTPAEFLQMFPVKKTYDGKRWECKDYYTTMEVMDALDRNKPIGEQMDPFELLYDYRNRDIGFFAVECMMIMSRSRRAEGEAGLMEQFCAEQGIQTYTLHEKEGYLYNPATGSTMPISKPKSRIPKWMKVVNGERKV